MKFRCTEPVIKDVIGGVFTVLREGDEVTVPDDWGRRAVEVEGWGVDVSHAHKQATRRPGVRKIATPKKVTNDQ